MELTGMLTKRGNKLKTWRRRYFELNNNNLCYYVYNGGPRKGEYIIDSKTTVLENNLRKHGFCLVQQNGRTLYMSADNESDKEMWMNALREIIIALQAETVSTRSKRISLSEEAWATNFEESNRVPSTSEIHIRVIEARDLAAKGSTNTYAKVFVGAISHQTKVSKKDLNPIWNEVFHFPYSSNLRYARVEVWDNDPMLSARDNFLGVIYIPIWCLPQNKSTPKWSKLGKRTSKSHVSGEIKILAFSDVPPDINVVRILREIQGIPELCCGLGANIVHSTSWKMFPECTYSKLQIELLGRFPSQFPPLETEILEDLSLLVSLRMPEKPTDTQAFYLDGMLLLTNYRLIFISHRRLAVSSALADPQHREIRDLTFHIPLSSIVSVTMNLQPDPSVIGHNTFGPFLDALTIKTNDSRSMCLIFHDTETTSNQTSLFNRDSSAQIAPGTRIQFSQKQGKVATRRSSAVSKKLFHYPFQRRRSQSVDNSISESSLRVLPSGRIRRRSIAQSSLGAELSYLEAADSPEGPPCQRLLTRINNKAINRISEIYFYESVHATLLSSIMKNPSSVDIHNHRLNTTLPDDEEEYIRWLQQLSLQDRTFISRVLVDGWNIYDPISEFKRIGIPDAAWRISHVNADYEVCSTYPAVLAVPTCLDDHRIVLAAQFRSRHRLPALSWRHPMNHCCICRSSQPLVGLSQNRSIDDEVLLEAINLSSKVHSRYGDSDNFPPVQTTSPLIIIDARPKINAQANQAAGKGYETGKGYENCRVLFMGIANIHVMRKSIDMLEELCTSSTQDDSTWLKNLEGTGWLHHISRVLTAAVKIVHCISYEEYSVLVHCSDGWDRTAQLTSLAMLMMDPFYRTYQGFMILVEKEWFSFGHKFADRLGWTEGGWIDGERSPVFHQFLDCVHQCIYQNPSIFEFTQDMLLFLGQHVLSGWFGNVFANSELDRSGLWDSTVSIWTFLDINKESFTNPYFQPLEAPYWIPNTSVRCLLVWELWFLRWSNAVWDYSWRRKNEDFSENPDDPSVWMEDNMVHNCCNCQRQFNLIRRRHHCRACGRIFCENCVKQTKIIPTISEKVPVRCCDECSNQMSLTGDDRPFSAESRSVVKQSSIASFFGVKHKTDNEVVIESESFADSLNPCTNPETVSGTLMQESKISSEEALSSERDTETIFSQLMDDSMTMYPDQKQVASMSILPAVSHRPFENFDYSESEAGSDDVEQTT